MVRGIHRKALTQRILFDKQGKLTDAIVMYFDLAHVNGEVDIIVIYSWINLTSRVIRLYQLIKEALL